MMVGDDIVGLMSEWRRDVHAHPETAYTEIRTSDLVASELARNGIEVHRGLAKTGVVGTLSTGPGPVIGMRADMDALFLDEQGQAPHMSQCPGKMHACGHDGHTAMLLGAAVHLSRHRDFRGTVHFIFQPAEENEGGGRQMIEDGLFERFPCSEVFGLHNWPALPLGRFAINRSTMMAAFDTFEITVTGRGCHGAMPEAGIDPFIPAAQIILGLQTITSRRLDALERAVVSVTEVRGGETWNVIPDAVVIRGSARSLSFEAQDRIERHLHEIADSMAKAHGAHADIVYRRRYPATINAAASAVKAARAAAAVVGGEAVVTECPPAMASEDFGFMLSHTPGAYIFMGVADGDHQAPLHSPHFDFNDAALRIGAAYWVRLAEQLLAA